MAYFHGQKMDETPVLFRQDISLISDDIPLYLHIYIYIPCCLSTSDWAPELAPSTPEQKMAPTYNLWGGQR